MAADDDVDGSLDGATWLTCLLSRLYMPAMRVLRQCRLLWPHPCMRVLSGEHVPMM